MIEYQIDTDGIVTLCMDMPGQAVNTMNQAFQQAFAAIVTRLQNEREKIKGVLLTSAKSTFFAGGDLRELLALKAEHTAICMDMLQANHRAMRSLEQLGRPVVALINGSALGGGSGGQHGGWLAVNDRAVGHGQIGLGDALHIGGRDGRYPARNLVDDLGVAPQRLQFG